MYVYTPKCQLIQVIYKKNLFGDECCVALKVELL